MVYFRGMKQGEPIATATAPQTPNKEGIGAERKTEKKQKPAKGGRNYVPKGGNGGRRDRSGRITKGERLDAIGVSAMIDQILVEDVDVIEINLKTQKRTQTKKSTLRATLEMLRHEALKNKSIPAAKEFLDRTLGRAKQRVEVSNDAIPEEEQRLPNKAEIAGAKAYLAALEDEEDD